MQDPNELCECYRIVIIILLHLVQLFHSPTTGQWVRIDTPKLSRISPFSIDIQKRRANRMVNSGATCCPTAGIHVVTARDNINENSAYYIDMLALGEKVQRSSSLSHSLSLTTFPASPFRVLLFSCHCPVSIFPSSAYNSKRENEKKKQQLFRNSDAGQLALSRPFLKHEHQSR